MDRSPHPLPSLRHGASWRLVACSLLLLGSGCDQSGWLDCSGVGNVAGSFRDSSSGSLTFRHGVAWREPDGAYSVLFTDEPLLAEAGRVSPHPAYEMGFAAEIVDALLVGYRFTPDGSYRDRFTAGRSTSSGWSSADSGDIAVDASGCVRGDVQLDGNGDGAFALPLTSPEHNAAMLVEALEVDTRSEAAMSAASLAADAAPAAEDPLAQWNDIHAQLMASDPAFALQAMNFSRDVAARLASDARVLAALERVRHQCPDPASASLDEYGDVIGLSRPAPGIVLEGKALTSLGENGAFLRLCYALQRNGEPIEQCFPYKEDCSRAVASGIDR